MGREGGKRRKVGEKVGSDGGWGRRGSREEGGKVGIERGRGRREGSSLTCSVLYTGFQVIVSLLKKSVSKRFTYQCLFQVNNGKFVEGSEMDKALSC